MKESVSAVFVTHRSVFFVKRQNYLSVFPGYYATPGGKVDATDSLEPLTGDIWPKDIAPQVLHALVREVSEELNFDLLKNIAEKKVLSIDYIGVAISPEFNPYRFKNHYFKITVNEEIDFQLDPNEAESGEWSTPLELHQKYVQGKMLAVPPAIQMLKKFTENLGHAKPIDMSLSYDPETEVPMIESLFGVRQFLPLSNTFPPANRTNSFIIGDGGPLAPKVLIDPSPKNESELKKFLKSILKIGFDSIFLTHHHPDHYQFVREIALEHKVPVMMSRDTHERILKRSGAGYFEGIEVITKKEGDIITQSLGEDVRVFEVPGHDEGQLALAPKGLSWFLAGDLIQSVGTVVIQAPEGDMKKYFSTLERIIELSPQYCIPSHGIISGGTHKIEETLKHRRSREAQILKLVLGGKTKAEMIESIYPGLENYLIPYAERTIEAHLLKLRSEGLI